MIYPTRRAVLLAVAGAIPAFLVAVLVPGYWYLGLLWSCAILGFLLVDAAASTGRHGLVGTLASQPRMAVGGTLDVTVKAQHAGARPRHIEARLGHDPLLDGETGGRGSPVDPETGTAVLRFRALRRGLAHFDGLWLRWHGPFGLAWKQTLIKGDHSVAILPDVNAVREQALELMQRDKLLGEHAQTFAGQGREFEALKEYQPGMGRRFIDWKRSARHGRLLAKEFQIEQNNNIVLAVDSGRLMCEPLDGVAKIDRAVTAALLMGFVALKGGDLVSLFSFDSQPRISSGAGRGGESFQMLQQLAAEIDYSSEETNFTLALTTLGSKLNRRSLVIVFTDFVDAVSAELMLRATGRLTERHIVLFILMRDAELETLADAAPTGSDDIARAVVAGSLLRERALVIGRLRMLGAQVIEAAHDEIGPALVERYFALKRADAL